MLAVAMMILVLLALAGDLFIKFPFGIRLLEAFFFRGIYTEEKDFEKVEFFCRPHHYLHGLVADSQSSL